MRDWPDATQGMVTAGGGVLEPALTPPDRPTTGDFEDPEKNPPVARETGALPLEKCSDGVTKAMLVVLSDLGYIRSSATADHSLICPFYIIYSGHVYQSHDVFRCRPISDGCIIGNGRFNSFELVQLSLLQLKSLFVPAVAFYPYNDSTMAEHRHLGKAHPEWADVR